MARILLRIFLLFSIFFLTRLSSDCQDLTGIWRGYFTTDYGEHYKLEFQVEHNKSMWVTGVSYSYLDTRFYGKATMTGQYSKGSLKFKIQEIKTVEVKNMDGSGTCIMNYNLSYVRSGREEYLEGDFLGKQEDRKNPKNNGKWGDCGGGRVFLRRVISSDFYVEPFLRDKPKPKLPSTNTAGTNKNNTNVPLTNKNPISKSNQKSSSKTSTPRTNPPIISGTNTNKRIDSIKKIEIPAVKENTSKATERKLINIPAILKSRENELIKTVFVSTNEVTVKLYDNGEIDDDTVSIYLDKQLVLSKKRLSTVPLVVNLKMDEDNFEHELVMVAENLGRIPPNTSLMIVNSGDDRYQVRITSTEQKNAVVRFIYKSK